MQHLGCKFIRKPVTCNLQQLGHIFILILIFSFFSCDEIRPQIEIPNVYVKETINLNLVSNQDIWMNGGYIYVEAGVRGIILYRKTAEEYIAFERNCTFQPMDSCATVNVDDSNLFLIDPCCTSTFDFEGNPTGGPAEWPLKRYQTVLDGNYLTITSDGF